MSETISVTLKVWRQKDQSSKGNFETYEAKNISTHISFLEMLDIVSEDLIKAGEEPIAFDHDCREGICGACSMVINGRAHGPDRGITTCQLHVRSFKDGETIWIEPWRAKSFPVLKDLVVDRSAFDRIMEKGGYVSVTTGGAPDGNAIPIPKVNAELAMDAAACIGCGACVAACKNASAMLFVSAKVSQYALLPQGQAERSSRVKGMMEQMQDEGFGNCTNSGQCEYECPKEITIANIARMNREYIKASILS